MLAVVSPTGFLKKFSGANFRRLLTEHFIKDFVDSPNAFSFIGVCSIRRLKYPKWFAIVSDLHRFSRSRDTFYFAWFANQRPK